MKFKFDAISTWLLTVILFIIAMVCIGGITRLTGSGLSITEWQPIMGAIPPLNEEEWIIAFQKYQGIPQFQKLNSNMILSDFKFIFFWEYFHRLVARMIAVVILVPGLYFYFQKKLTKPLIKKVSVGFLLGGLQGLMGWLMVKSGLSELVYVSHIRLAAHLLLALIILSYWSNLFLWWQSELYPEKKPTLPAPSKGAVMGLATLLFLQIAYGAYVAGLKAGHVYNTYPTMNGLWIPEHLFILNPTWLNFFNNSSLVQFIHRWLAVGLVGFSIRTLLQEYKAKSAGCSDAATFLGLLFLQFILGVSTLVYHVPLVLASLHQLNACLLVICLTVWARKTRNSLHS